MPKEKPKKCAIYTRKSSEEGLEQKFNSLHAQRESCEAFIKSQSHEGWVLNKAHYDDGGFSGGTLERPALKLLMKDIKVGKIQVIVVYKIDRLTRSLTDFSRLVEVFDKYGVSFVSVTQHFNTTTSMGRLTLNVLLSFAQYEREITGERIRDKFLASKKKGMWMGGHPPLGYDLKDRKLHVNPMEAEQVKKIFPLYIDLRCVSKVQAKLAEENIESKEWTSASGVKYGGKAFSRGALYTILKNSLYIGKISHKGKTYEGEQDAILKTEVWENTQALLKKNRQTRKITQDNSSLYPLKGLLFDNEGRLFKGTYAQKRDGRRYRYYVSDDLEGLKQRASPIRLPAKEIEDLVHQNLERHPKVGEFTGWGKVKKVLSHITLKEELMILSFQKPIKPDVLEIPFKMGKRGNQTLILGPKGEQTLAPPKIDPGLLKSLSKAWSWREALEKGQCTSFSDLATKEGCTERYIRKILPLAFLSPMIIEKIITGTLQKDITQATLIREKVPIIWPKTNRVLGFN